MTITFIFYSSREKKGIFNFTSSIKMIMIIKCDEGRFLLSVEQSPLAYCLRSNVIFFIINLSSFPPRANNLPPASPSCIFHKLNLSVEEKKKRDDEFATAPQTRRAASVRAKNNPGNTSKKLNDMRKFSSTYTYTHA